MTGISIITCTSDRPEAFALCERWMSQQTEVLDAALFHWSSKFGVEWIVSDDGREPANCTMGQIHLRHHPQSQPANSFRRNLIAGLNAATMPVIAFIEDDDWYAPDYLWAAHETITTGDRIIWGENVARYYNVRQRMHSAFHQEHRASLCQTVMRSELRSVIVDHFKRHPDSFHVDFALWTHVRRKLRGKAFLTSQCRSVGIKGMPGKRNLGVGRDMHQCGGKPDPRLKILETWIGDDVEAYEGFGR